MYFNLIVQDIVLDMKPNKQKKNERDLMVTQHELKALRHQLAFSVNAVKKSLDLLIVCCRTVAVRVVIELE